MCSLVNTAGNIRNLSYLIFLRSQRIQKEIPFRTLGKLDEILPVKFLGYFNIYPHSPFLGNILKICIFIPFKKEFCNYNFLTGTRKCEKLNCKYKQSK